MRIVAAVFIVGSMVAGAASASSITKLSSSAKAPSIVQLGAAAKAAPAIDTETTSSAVAKPADNTSSDNRRRLSEPLMVIRGGIVGDAFASNSTAPEVTLPARNEATAAASSSGSKPASSQSSQTSAPPPFAGPAATVE